MNELIKNEEFLKMCSLGDDRRVKYPYVFISKDETLWNFYTFIHGADIDTAQPMYRYSVKGNYSEKSVNWDYTDAVYPRLGGSFTPEKMSGGIDESKDGFTPKMRKRYEEAEEILTKTPGFSKEVFDSFVNEKCDLATGKLYGFKIKENYYPFARRTGFSLRGMPIEIEYNGKDVTLLPLYSNALSCALMLFSFDKCKNFDSNDYIICSLSDEEEFVLSENNGTLSLEIKKEDGTTLPVGMTDDLGESWQIDYDYSEFKINQGITEKLETENKWENPQRKKYFTPSPVKFFKALKIMVENERILDFGIKNKKKEPELLTERTVIAGLEDYEIPQIEDIFEPIKEHAHGSGIAKLPDGEMICVWFQADGERKANDGRILASRKPYGGGWSEPFVIADVAGLADINPTVYVDKNDTLWFFWYPVFSNCWESSQPKYRYAEKGHYEYANGYIREPKWDWQGILNPSRDDELQGRATGFEDGKYIYGDVCGECRYITEEQFSEHPLPEKEYVKIEDRYITDEFVVAYRNSLLEAIKTFEETRPLGIITQAINFYLLGEIKRGCRVLTGTENDYKKWKPICRCLGWQTKNKPIEFEYEGKERMLLNLYTDGVHCSLTAYTDDYGKTWEYGLPFAHMIPEQGANVMMKDGTLRTYFRNSFPLSNVMYLESSDGGKTYGDMKFVPDMYHEGGFDIIKLDDGRWVMSISDFYIAKGTKKHNRSRLCIAVSDDDGKTWKRTPIEIDKSSLQDYHYSAITKDANGNIYVSYTFDDEKNTDNIRCAVIKRKGGKTECQ